MRKKLISLIVLILTCNCSFSQDDSYAGVSYTVIPASHPVFDNDKEFEKTEIGSEEFNCFASYGDTLSKNTLWYTSFSFSSIKSNNDLNGLTKSALKEETPAVFTYLPKEKFYSWSLGFQHNLNEKYSLVYLNSLMLTDVSVEGKHKKSYNLDGIIYANRLFNKGNAIGIGGYINTNFREVSAFPVLTASYEFKRWELNSSLPLEFSADYNLSQRFSIGGRSNLNIYYFDLMHNEENTESYVTHTILKLGANVECKLRYVALYSGIGLAYQEYEYSLNGSTKFTLPESPYMEIGLRLIDN